MADGPRGYAELEFDLPRALLTSLIATLDAIVDEPLLLANASELPDDQGVYQLLLDGEPVYVGKTDGKAGLSSRLVRHSRKILHRVELDPLRVSFKAVRVYVFTAVDIEGDLIGHYGGVGGKLSWNGSGFGSNDPGRERDTTRNKPTNFDYLFPIDIDRPMDFGLNGPCTAEMALSRIRVVAPYTVRVARAAGGRKLHEDLATSNLDFPTGLLTMREAISQVVSRLPPGWQATKLLGYVILYKEAKDYPDGEVIARS